MDKHITAAVDYVRDNLERFEIEAGWHCIGNRQPIPSDLEAKIYDLLEEYGSDHDLPECWWEGFGDVEDIFMMINND